MVRAGRRRHLTDADVERQAVRIAGKSVGQDLERDVAVHARIMRPIDLAHPTSPDRAGDFVTDRYGDRRSASLSRAHSATDRRPSDARVRLHGTDSCLAVQELQRLVVERLDVLVQRRMRAAFENQQLGLSDSCRYRGGETRRRHAVVAPE